jgi:hypothetical protein
VFIPKAKVVEMTSQLEKRLSAEPYVDSTAVVIDSRLAAYTEVGPVTLIQESTIY